MAIFPILSCPSLQYEIVSKTDVDSRLCLSQVNRAARVFLDNAHFGELLVESHPRLAESPFVFRVLRTFHRDNCWKAACWILAGPHRQITSLHFLNQALLQLPRLKEQYEQRIREISGSGQEDPSSLMGNAWVERERFSEFGEKMCSMREKNHVIELKLKVAHSRDVRRLKSQIAHLELPERRLIAHSIHLLEGWVREELEALPEEGLLYVLKERLMQRESYAVLARHNIVYFDDDYLQLRLEKAKIDQETLYLEADSHFQENIKKFLEADRRYQPMKEEVEGLRRQVNTIGLDMSVLNSRGPAAREWLLHQHDFLALEAEFARDAEALCSDKEVPILDQCITKTGLLLMETDPGVLSEGAQELEALARSLSALTRGRIGQGLYNACAEGAQEENWVENHFHEHLPSLHMILLREKALREGMQKQLLDGEAEWSHPSLGRLDATHYREGLLVLGPEFSRAPHLPIGEADAAERASSKWNLLEKLLPQPFQLSEKQRSKYNASFRSSPEFGQGVISLIFVNVNIANKSIKKRKLEF